MLRNMGGIPGMAQGRRVRVRLFNGRDSAHYDPPHWDADTLNWSIRQHNPHPFDIEYFEVIA